MNVVRTSNLILRRDSDKAQRRAGGDEHQVGGCVCPQAAKSFGRALGHYLRTRTLFQDLDRAQLIRMRLSISGCNQPGPVRSIPPGRSRRTLRCGTGFQGASVTGAPRKHRESWRRRAP